MVLEVEIVDKVQRILVPSNKRHRIIYGGRGKGASWSLARILLVKGMAEPRFIVCVREIQKTIANSVKKLLEDTIDTFNLRWFYTVKLNEIVGMNGTKLYLMDYMTIMQIVLNR